jgi:hypothetical protein
VSDAPTDELKAREWWNSKTREEQERAGKRAEAGEACEVSTSLAVEVIYALEALVRAIRPVADELMQGAEFDARWEALEKAYKEAETLIARIEQAGEAIARLLGRAGL